MTASVIVTVTVLAYSVMKKEMNIYDQYKTTIIV